jgi:hypothetical protein
MDSLIDSIITEEAKKFQSPLDAGALTLLITNVAQRYSEMTEPKHYYVADNSDAFRNWLDKKGIEWTPAEHYTAIHLPNDIFDIGMEFGVYKYIHKG